MNKTDILESLTNDCFIVFCRIIIINTKKLFSEADVLAFASRLVRYYDSQFGENIDEVIKQYDSLLCELKFILRILREKQKVQWLEGGKRLREAIGIKGSSRIDFLVADERTCEITSAKELPGYYGEDSTEDEGSLEMVDIGQIKPKLISLIEQKLEGKLRIGGKEGQIGKFLKNNPDKKVNLIVYLPESCNKKLVYEAIVGEYCLESDNSRKRVRLKNTGRIMKKNVTKLNPLFSLIKKYFSKVKFIFISRFGDKIYHIEKSGTEYSLSESPTLYEILIK